MALSPSGEQYEITSGDTVAVVTEMGATLRSLRVGDRPLLDGFEVAERLTGGRGQHLLPWPNRVRDGRYTWEGRELQLAVSEPATSCAIHGLTRSQSWRAAAVEADSVTMSYRLFPQTGWSWLLDLTVATTVDVTGVTVRTSATNRSDTAAPFAAGAHPYLAVGLDTVDGATLQLPAGTYLPTDDQQIPTGAEPVEGSAYDFRTPRALGSLEIDYAFADLDRDADGVARARLSGRWTTEVWLDAAYPYLEVFTGDTLPAAQRRRGLGVEPMTGPPNALASGTDLVRLEPGDTWSGAWGIRLVD